MITKLIKHSFMKNLFTLLLLLVTPMSLQAQEKVTISGYVNDAANGESLIGATVFVQETASGTVTNVYGFYSIILEPGDYAVDAQRNP